MKLASRLTLAATAVASILVFIWPLLISAEGSSQATLAQGVFIALMPALLALIVIEFSSGQIEAKQLAVLGVLIALNAVVRILGAGTAGIETAFFIIILGGFVFGAGFGFILGAGSLLVSALLVGGIGPWLPFQMMAAGLIGIGAGLLPKFNRAWMLRLTLIAYAVLAAFVYGGLMTMWSWPFLAGNAGPLAYSAGAPLLENLTRFLQYEIVTGGLLWDLGRAITTSVLLLLTAPALLATLNRVATRAGIEKL